MEGAAVAFRRHVHTYDDARGRRWRGGTKRAIAGQPKRLEVMAEHAQVLVYQGPIAELTEIVPVVCRCVGKWPYRIAEVRGSDWASSVDAARARAGEGGIYGVVPFDLRIGRDEQGRPKRESRVLWREEQWPVVSGL